MAYFIFLIRLSIRIASDVLLSALIESLFHFARVRKSRQPIRVVVKDTTRFLKNSQQTKQKLFHTRPSVNNSKTFNENIRNQFFANQFYLYAQLSWIAGDVRNYRGLLFDAARLIKDDVKPASPVGNWAGEEWVSNIGHAAAGLELIRNLNSHCYSQNPIRVFYTKLGLGTEKIVEYFSEFIEIKRISSIESRKLQFLYFQDRIRKDMIPTCHGLLEFYDSINSHRVYFRPITPKKELIEEACVILEELKFDSGRPFVLLHVREGDGGANRGAGNYLISDTFPAIKMLVDSGMQVVRIGDSSMSRFDFSSFTREQGEIIYDYAHFSKKNSLTDFYLFSHCEFMIGCDSGPICVPQLFGKPVLRLNANHALMTERYPGYVFPTRFENSDGTLISLEEQYSKNIGWSQAKSPNPLYSRRYASPDDIKASVQDMIDLTAVPFEGKKLLPHQEKFLFLANRYVTYPGMTLPPSQNLF